MRSIRTYLGKGAAPPLLIILMLSVCASSLALISCIDPNNPPRNRWGEWTRADNLKVAPQWTPDGRLIVFEHRETIYTVNAKGTKLKRITSGKDRDYERHEAPAISPDGTRIAYSTTRHKVRRSEGWIRNYDIEVMNLDGSNRKRLTTSRYWDLNPVWSDEGTKLIFSREPRSKHLTYGTYIVNDDGTEEEHVTWAMGHSHKPHRNGRYALVLSESELIHSKTGIWPEAEWEIKRTITLVDKGETFLATVNLDFSELIEHKRIPDVSFPNPGHPTFQRISMEEISGISWSPDGKKLAYIQKQHQPEDARKLIQHRKGHGPEPGSRLTLNMLNLADSKETAVELADTNCAGQLTWSPNGRHILMNSYAVCMADMETGKVTQFGLTSGESWPTTYRRGYQPPRASWSPRGDRIAIRNRCTQTKCLQHGGRDDVLIFGIEPDGTGATPLVQMDHKGNLKAAQK